jgi:quercetin dioxygenase-like cupin family protein
MQAINPTHSFTFDGAMLNVYHADKGQGLPRHEHSYSHATVCHAGRCAIRKESVYIEMTKQTQPVTLKANEWHEIEALEDGTVFCNVFSETLS